MSAKIVFQDYYDPYSATNIKDASKAKTVAEEVKEEVKDDIKKTEKPQPDKQVEKEKAVPIEPKEDLL